MLFFVGDLEGNCVGLHTGGSLAGATPADEEDECDDIGVTRREAAPGRGALEDELANWRPPPRSRGLLRKLVPIRPGAEKPVPAADPELGDKVVGQKPDGEAAEADVPEEDNECWDEEDELAHYIASRQMTGEGTPWK